MKNLESFGIQIPLILLPAQIDLQTWPVIACDQYTQDVTYWKTAAELTAGKPSTLNLILPEVYLNSPDKEERIKNIHLAMNKYLSTGIFAPPKRECIYVERKTAYGRLRHGLVLAIDLETYEWKPFSKAYIRSTEATIVERIPPRMEIRRGAPLETPHIMLLVNDPDHCLVEAAGSMAKASGRQPVYAGTLMQNGGSITGWAIDTEPEIKAVEKAVNRIAEQNTAADGSVFLFAAGDGNHSLATAKAVWDEYKKQAHTLNSPVRYALVEIVNIYDSGLTFEPIHRVLFNLDPRTVLSFVQTKLGGTVISCTDASQLEKAVRDSSSSYGFAYTENGKLQFRCLQTEKKELAVSLLQPVLDTYIQVHKDTTIDYIHGSADVLKLAEKGNTVSVLLPPVAKDSFFATINGRGPLPRKSFSMGEADEKRFYLECRSLF